MNFYTLIKLFEGEKTAFYTIQEEAGDRTLVWFYDFLLKIEPKDAEQMKSLLQHIANKYGAKSVFFRHEGAADALPSVHVGFVEPDARLRLYCMRLNDNAVILFNGGYKDAATAQQSRISMHFRASNEMARKIQKAIREGRIRFDRFNKLTWDDDLIL